MLYNGERKWTAPLELSELIDSIPGQIHLYQPNIRYALLEESTFEGESLPEAKNLVSALFGLENSKKPEDIQRILAALIEWLKLPEQTSLRRNFTVWIKRVLLPARVPGIQFEQVHDLHEVHSMLAERVISWTEEWKQEGIQVGVEQGRLEEKVNNVQTLLVLRFGPLSEDQVQYLNSASAEQLDQWRDSIFEIKSLNDVFGKK